MKESSIEVNIEEEQVSLLDKSFDSELIENIDDRPTVMQIDTTSRNNVNNLVSSQQSGQVNLENSPVHARRRFVIESLTDQPEVAAIEPVID